MGRSYKRDAFGRFAGSGGGPLGGLRAKRYNKRAKKITHLEGVVREDTRTAKGPIGEIHRKGFGSRADFARDVKVTQARVVKLRAKQVKAARKVKF